jgi:alpha-galactosidase
MQPLSFPNLQIISYADQIAPVSGGYILTGANVSLEFEGSPKGYYRHGWQSWSLTTWQPLNFRLPVQKPAILHPMQTDPLYVHHSTPNGSWLGALELENGKILLLGALGLEAHVALHDKSHGDIPQLHGWYETGSGDWFVGYGDEASVFGRYAELLGHRFGRTPGPRAPNGVKPTPRVWCSWYSLYTAIDENLLLRVFDELADLPFDVFQVDDGWQVSIGDWEPNEKFPSGMVALAAKIRAAGRIPGLWLAPLLAVPSSTLYRQHPDWLLRDPDSKLVSAGFNWGQPLYALDTTHPAVLDWLTALMKRMRAWGFDYLKLDFLYAGALPGKRHGDMPREAAYRQGLQVLREAMGTDAYFLTCGAPIIPSLGLCDAMRIGPDVAGEWENYRDATLLYNLSTPGVKNAIRTAVNRLWLQPLVATDPDVAYFRSQYTSMTNEQKGLLQDLCQVCNYKATSILPQWLSTDGREEVRAFLESSPEVKRTGRYSFTLDGRPVDFGPAMPLPPHPRGLAALGNGFMGWLANRGWALRLLFWLGKKELQKVKASL